MPGTTLDFSKELGELSGRLVGRALTLGLQEILHERRSDPLVDLERQSPQQVDGSAMSSDLLLARQQTFHQLVVLRLELVALGLDLLQCGGHLLGCVVVHGSKVSPEPARGKGRAEPIAPATDHCALGEGCGCGLSHEGAAPGPRVLGRRDGSADAGPRFGSESRSLGEANSGPIGLRQDGWAKLRGWSRHRFTEGVALSIPQLP